MKIVHTLLRYPPATGGVEQYTHDLVEKLRARGEDVRVETTFLKTHHPPTLLPAPVDDPPHVHRHAAHSFDAIGYPIPEGLKEELGTLPMDILHAHGFWYAPADISARIAHKRRVPFVLNPYYYNTGNRRTMKWQLYRILYGRSTIAAADAVVVISPFEHELLKEDRFLLPRVELIPPGIDPNEFNASQENPFPRWGVKSSHILLFAGRIAQSKGVDLIIRALPIIRRQIPDAHLVLIGEDFGFRESCEELAKMFQVTDAITWAGTVSRADLLGAYRHASVFVFPSRYEAFGIVALEAAASGCPVVATRTSALPYVVQDEKTGVLFAPEQIEELGQKTLALLQHPERARVLGEQGRTRAAQEFSWDRSITKLYRLYEDLLRRQS